MNLKSLIVLDLSNCSWSISLELPAADVPCSRCGESFEEHSHLFEWGLDYSGYFVSHWVELKKKLGVGKGGRGLVEKVAVFLHQALPPWREKEKMKREDDEVSSFVFFFRWMLCGLRQNSFSKLKRLLEEKKYVNQGHTCVEDVQRSRHFTHIHGVQRGKLKKKNGCNVVSGTESSEEILTPPPPSWDTTVEVWRISLSVSPSLSPSLAPVSLFPPLSPSSSLSSAEAKQRNMSSRNISYTAPSDIGPLNPFRRSCLRGSWKPGLRNCSTLWKRLTPMSGANDDEEEEEEAAAT